MKRKATPRLSAVPLLLLLLGNSRVAFAADPPAPPPPAKPPDAAPAKPAKPPEAAPGKPAEPSAADAEQGKRHFLLGLQLYKQQVYDAALAEFEQSYALGRRPTALRNVAQCHRELKQFGEAYDSLELLLSRHGAQLKDTEKADIQAALSDLANVTAALALTVNVPGAEVTVDGRSVGTSPLNHKLRLNAGDHRIRATKSGFDPAELSISLLVQQDDAETLTLKAVTAIVPSHAEAALVVGHLRVKAMPFSADILLDGERIASGKYEGDVSEGDHALDVAAPGFVSAHRTIRMSGGQSAVENVALDPYVPEKPPEKSLTAKLYGSFELAILRQINGYEPLLTACGDQQVSCNQPTYPSGAGVIHVGYAFGWVGVELVGAFSVGVRSESLTATGPVTPPGQLLVASSNAQRDDQMTATAFGGFVGLGLRATSSDPLVRVTAGIAPGLSLRHYTLSRTLSNGVDATYADEGTSAAVGVATDIALLIGSSPGPRFRIGLFLWMDFSQGDILAAGGPPLATSGVMVERPAFLLQQGAQFLIGPTIGVQFGR